MRNLVLVSALFASLSACGGTGPAVPEQAAVYCVNRSDLRDSETSRLARICGESNISTRPGVAALDITDPANSPNEFVRNEAMYRAGNAAMIAMAAAN